jgi:phage gp45-like
MTGDELLGAVGALVEPAANRIKSLLVRGQTILANDSNGIQTLRMSALFGEVRSNVERLQDYGFTANPPPDSDVAAFCVGGNRDHLLAIKVDNRTLRKKNLLPGESALYNGLTGDFFALLTGGLAVLKATSMVKLGSATAVDPVARKSDLDALAAIFNAHVHPVPALPVVNATPSAPGPVTAGPGTTTATATPQVPTASTKVFSE